MTKEQIIKQLLDMAKHPTVTLPRDCEALKAAADLLAEPQQNLSCKSTQARLAASWGYVKAEPLLHETNCLLSALTTIAEGTYDVWSNGAQAQRAAILALEKYKKAHGIKVDA